MHITLVGCGDAFGSGGRFNTCLHIAAAETQFLIDCGASSLIALERAKIDRNTVETIFITHFHGDHFGGIPYVVLGTQFSSKRTDPLTIVGPVGLEAWFERVIEATFPSSSTARRRFEIRLIVAEPDRLRTANGVAVEAARVRHGPVEGPPRRNGRRLTAAWPKPLARTRCGSPTPQPPPQRVRLEPVADLFAPEFAQPHLVYRA